MKILIPLIMMLHVAWSHDRVNMSEATTRKIDYNNWHFGANGYEDTYMEYSHHWKRWMVEVARDLVKEIRGKVHQLDTISWVGFSDVRHQVGQTIGRILELYRQQVDMYRRMKRVVESRFHYLRPEISMKFNDKPDLQGLDSVVEPSLKYGFHPNVYNKDWANGNQHAFTDYKPHVYIVALEYITKRESDIEHLVMLLTDHIMEDEVGHVLPYDAPVSWNWKDATKYHTTYKPVRRLGHSTKGLRENNEEDKLRDKEEMLKAKMRAEYYKKKMNNK